MKGLYILSVIKIFQHKGKSENFCNIFLRYTLSVNLTIWTRKLKHDTVIELNNANMSIKFQFIGYNFSIAPHLTIRFFFLILYIFEQEVLKLEIPNHFFVLEIQIFRHQDKLSMSFFFLSCVSESIDTQIEKNHSWKWF